MNETLKNIEWTQVIYTIWTFVLLPVFTYTVTQIGNYAKAKKIDKYTDILYQNVVDAVKDVYETLVKDMKGTTVWNTAKMNEVKHIAKTKAINSLTASAYKF